MTRPTYARVEDIPPARFCAVEGERYLCVEHLDDLLAGGRVVRVRRYQGHLRCLRCFTAVRGVQPLCTDTSTSSVVRTDPEPGVRT